MASEARQLTTPSNEYYLIDKDEMENFMYRCMIAVGTKNEHAKSLASCLIAGDHRGHFSHGLNRLDMYVRDVETGTTNSKDEPEVIKETESTALVNGKNLLGPVVGNYCMKLAIEKAKKTGIGMVVANRSNHFGIAGYYSMQALQHKMIGLAFTNTSPLSYPTRANKRTFGTNPIAFSAPASHSSFDLDMATTTVAFGKVELNSRKGISIPGTWGADKDGHATTNPKDVLEEGGLLPLGGIEETGGYKGYGLQMMVEILCGILAGSNFGPNIRTWQTSSGEANLGQCFMAINTASFAEASEDRLQSLIDYVHNMEPIDKDKPVLIAGDLEKFNMKKADQDHGISYHVNQIIYAQNLAKKLDIEPPKSKKIEDELQSKKNVV